MEMPCIASRKAAELAWSHAKPRWVCTCRRTRQFIQTVLPKMGISATVIDPADMDGLEQALKTQRVSLFFSGDLPLCTGIYAEPLYYIASNPLPQVRHRAPGYAGSCSES